MGVSSAQNTLSSTTEMGKIDLWNPDNIIQATLDPKRLRILDPYGMFICLLRPTIAFFINRLRDYYRDFDAGWSELEDINDGHEDDEGCSEVAYEYSTVAGSADGDGFGCWHWNLDGSWNEPHGQGWRFRIHARTVSRSMTNKAQEAWTLACKAHANQKYGVQPYTAHLAEVATVLASVPGGDEDCLVITAYLHDVVEDTEVTPLQIQELFGLDVSLMVGFCTDEEGRNRKERKALTYSRNQQLLESGEPWVHKAALVKLADRVANLRSCVRESHAPLLDMYRKEKESFYLAHYCSEWAVLWEEYECLLSLP